MFNLFIRLHSLTDGLFHAVSCQTLIFLAFSSRFGHGEICSWRDVDSFFEMRLSLCAFSQADQTEGCRGLRISKSPSEVCYSP